MSLYLKYRPDDFSQMKGNAETLTALDTMLSNPKTCPHVFMFYGPTGTGKTTLGRIIGTRLGCVGRDFKEINSSNFNGVDDIREIIKSSQFAPIEGSVIVWLLDEVQKITGAAFNALLKILEDTPKHVYFVLCSTEPQKIPDTIKGRCQQFQLKILTDSQMFSLLRKIVKEEEQTLEQEIYDQIIQDSLGHPRNALQILEQVLSVPSENRLEIARQTSIQYSQGIELCRALINRLPWKTVSVILVGLKDQEAEAIRRMVLGYMQAILLKGENDFAAFILEEFLSPFYDSGFSGLTYACYSIIKK